LRQGLPGAGAVALALAGGLIAGLAGGAVGQGLYQFGAGRGVGWALLGALAGLGLAVFVPNLRPAPGLLGGGRGGVAGARGFLLSLGALTAEGLGGRLAGAGLLGLGIGLMVALAELAFRRAWLEVCYGGKETVRINLGPEPVKVGGDSRACTVW